jgi:NitT/TauT family transport system ATP-binding protein
MNFEPATASTGAASGGKSTTSGGHNTVLAARGLSKAFGVGGGTNTVFEDIDLDIEAGSFVSIVGPSGCGKTTLLRILAGLQSPTSGTVYFKNDKITGPPPNLLFVFQQYTKSVLPWRTVIDNVCFGLEVRGGMSKRQRREHAREFLRLVGLEGKDDLFPIQLSGGMQQRVAIARALVCEPEILLMDEPFSALDALTRMTLQRLVMRLWDQLDITIGFVTHDIEEALLLSTRVVGLGVATRPSSKPTSASTSRTLATRSRSPSIRATSNPGGC